MDIGCGPGMLTIELAKNTNGTIYALDIHEAFLERLNESSKLENVNEKIKTLNVSMFSLDENFTEDELDLICSEGSIYIIGFKEELEKWKPLLKNDGYLVASEISWLKNNLPKEIKEYWDSEYPSMNNIKDNLEVIKEYDYKLVDYFKIPESSWFDSCYSPLEERVHILYKTYKGKKMGRGSKKSSLKKLKCIENTANITVMCFI